MNTSDKPLSQENFVYEWFKLRPDQDIPHSKSKSEIELAWVNTYGTRFEDVDRTIRRLTEEGKLVKVTKGVYRLSTEFSKQSPTLGFTALCRNSIFERDGFRCCECKDAKDQPESLVATHVVPLVLGGGSVLSNGVTLCSIHALIHILETDRKQGRLLFQKIYEFVSTDENSTMSHDFHLWSDLVSKLVELNPKFSEKCKDWL